MSRFLHSKFKNMIPYRLGEQPTDRPYIKLNSNETSMAPSKGVQKVLREAADKPMGYYSDQDATVLREALGAQYNVNADQILVGNGADEILSFCFLAYGEEKGFAFPDVTYGFYKTCCEGFGIPYLEIPLSKDFTLDMEPYLKCPQHIVFPNPNAPTGILLDNAQIEQLLQSNLERIVIIDEAYLGYGSKSCIPLLKKYDNLIVVHTMSKARNIAGLHVGYGIGNKVMMSELNDIKNCFNPNNLNQVTLDAAVAAVKDQDYTEICCKRKIAIREKVTSQLERLGFQVIPSNTNFVLFTHPQMDAVALENKFREHGILVRHYNHLRIQQYIRMTIGTKEEMDQVISALHMIIGERCQNMNRVATH